VTKTVQIEGGKIVDWNSFHTVFSETIGFPAFYGKNMDAWVDCMTYLDEPESGMTSVSVKPGDVLVLIISGVADLRRSCPEIYDAIVECSSFVNWRRIERGREAVLALAFCS
jgi:hypothetical protein